MKKLLIAILLCLLTLSGCGKDPVPTNTEVESFRVDMSGYRNMSSTNHQFLGVNPTEMLNVIKEGRSAVFYIGYLGCHNCQQAVQYINQAAEELGVTVYYMDCYGEKEDFNAYLEETIEILNPILATDPDGHKGVFTPHVFAVVNGELMESKVGASFSSQKDIDKLVDEYKNIMRYFVETE